MLLQIDAQVAMSKSSIMLDKAYDFLWAFGPKLIGAVLAYIIGSWLINKIVTIVRKLLFAKKFDTSLQGFLVSLCRVSLIILLFLSIAGIIGINITGFAALLAGAGLAIGAALNGSLGNLAGGVTILIFKPFKVGDMIEAQDKIGIVTEVGIFNTVMLSPENKVIILPNGALSTGVITNYTTHGNLRVDLTMAIAPDMDIDNARTVAIQAMLKHPDVLPAPAPEVNVLKVADGMTTLAIRPYTTQQSYWDVYFGVQELVKKAFDEKGIDGPVPHRVIVHK